MDTRQRLAMFGTVGLVAVLNSAVNSSATLPVVSTVETKETAFDNCHGPSPYANPNVSDVVHRSIEQDVKVTRVVGIPIYRELMERREYDFACEKAYFRGFDYNPFMGARRISREGFVTPLDMPGRI